MPTQDLLTVAQASSLLLSAVDDGVEVALLVVLEHPEMERIGGRLVVTGSEVHGSFGDPTADAAARTLARDGLGHVPGVETGPVSLPLEGGEEIHAFLELHHPQPEMVIVGAGHVAQPLCTVGSILGLQVRVLDDRPEFATRERFPEAREVRRVDFSDPFASVPLHPWSSVILVTRGHRYDYECLRKVLLSHRLPGYIGMIGSRRRVRATFQILLEEGIPKERLAQVRAPIGLDLGAETPAEIAVAVAAEMVHHLRGGSCRPLQEVESILDRFLSGKDGGNEYEGKEAP
jgi:xanthine dehydrogenase accessory factor